MIIPLESAATLVSTKLCSSALFTSSNKTVRAACLGISRPSSENAWGYARGLVTGGIAIPVSSAPRVLRLALRRHSEILSDPLADV